MTRKRTRESLAHMLCEPLPHLRGARRGQDHPHRAATTSCAKSCARRGSSTLKEFRVVASAAVVEMLLDEESVHLAGLSEFIGKPISLSAEPTSSPQQYDIVLL
jgi:ribonuclease G